MLTLACGQLAEMRQEPQRSSQTLAEKLLHLTKCFAQSLWVLVSQCPEQPHAHQDRGIAAAPSPTMSYMGNPLPASPKGW